MGKIKQLPIHEAHKIAAGQVIDRPAHVVKELLENSIDAGATKIDVIIQDGGKKLIRVIDNGCGMAADDASVCFDKHATSKIRSIDELISLTSYGFRGEALASIAAVSEVTIRTKETNALEGTIVTMANHTQQVTSGACPEGTDISVRNLFYTMPARLKFLKKRETETRHSIQFINAISLAHPELHITLEVDEKTVYNCPPQETIKDRFGQLWDHTTSQHMLNLHASHSSGMFSITGAISNHQWFRYDRSTLYFLVNNRWVLNQGLSRALLKGYNNVLPHGKYPMGCIAIFINPAHLDINMHPRKEEVKFANPRLIETLIEDTVRSTLEKNLSRHIQKDITLAKEPIAAPLSKPAFSGYRPASFSAIDQLFEVHASAYQSSERGLPNAVPPSAAPRAISEESSQQLIAKSSAIHPILETEMSNPYTLIGQYNKTYLLIEQEDGLFLIDQHAAHERVLYELFEKRFHDVATINLMFPQIITLSPEDLALIEPHILLFKEHGITLDRFAHDQLIIQATPVHIKNISLTDLITEVISWIKEYHNVDQQEFIKKINNKLRAQMACKAAVKAGDTLTTEQMQELLKDLYATDNRFACPHGRPTGWLMHLNDIEKKFRRKL